MKQDPFEAPVPCYVGWAMRREEVLPTLARVQAWWGQWEFVPQYGPLGPDAQTWLEEREKAERIAQLAVDTKMALANDPGLLERLRAANRLRRKLLVDAERGDKVGSDRSVRGSRSAQVRGARLKNHILLTLREAERPMLVRDIVGVIEDRTGRAVSESAVSHSLLRMARAKPAQVVRVRRGRYVGLLSVL